jgi:hypothetical protein
MMNEAHRQRSSAILILLACTACGESVAPSDPYTWHTHTPPIPLGAGEEILDLCYSWTLNNPEPIYVNRVDLLTSPGAHHSNWAWVPERSFDGPDGLWRCSERGFMASTASFSNGGVLFAQSTQATEDSQAFLPGAVIALPPRVRVIGDLHLLNYGLSDAEVELDMTLRGIPAEEVTTRLSPLAIDYTPLEIQPRGRSEFTTECDIETVHQLVLERPVDFNIHYILPHYHSFGDLLRVELVGGTRDGEVIAETESSIGEPLAITFPEPVSMVGATGIRVRCGYENPTEDMVYYGNGDGEMCIAVGYTDSPNTWLGMTLGENSVEGVVDGVTQNTSPCETFSMVSTHTRLGF